MKIYKLLLLSIDEKAFALNLLSVVRVLQAVEITTLLNAPDNILGIINYQGKIIPVINTRKLFLLPEREIDIMDKFVIANTSKRTVIIVADEIQGISELSDEEIIKQEQIVPGISFFEGIIKQNEKIVIVYNIDSFLGIEDEKKLEENINSIF